MRWFALKQPDRVLIRWSSVVGGAAGAGTWGQVSIGTFRWVRGTSSDAVAGDHARNVRDPSRVLEQGPDRQRAPTDCSGGGHPSMEPPNPDAATMGWPVRASKRVCQFDTARDLRQRVFMKGASWRGKSPRPWPGAGVLMRGPQPRDGLSRSAHQPSTCTVTLLTLWALGAVTVSRPSRYTAWSWSRSIGWGKRKLRLQVP